MKLRNKKTGEIGELAEVMSLTVYEPNMPLCGNSILGQYDSLAKLCEEWEDYEPKEPLIKDKKIRKAVRAWAEINSIEEVIYAERTDRSLCNLTDMGVDDFAIEFVGWVPTLKDGETYTIADLCGEGEE